jgi:hypothetical protein
VLSQGQFTVPTGTPPTTPPGGSRTGAVTGAGGKCVDVAGASSADGTAVQLYDCNGSAAQSWTVGSDGTLRALGKCLDVTGQGTANGTKLQVWECNGSGAQQWVAESDGHLRNPRSGRCLDDPGGSTASATRLQIWDRSANPWFEPHHRRTPPRAAPAGHFAAGTPSDPGHVPRPAPTRWRRTPAERVTRRTRADLGRVGERCGAGG